MQKLNRGAIELAEGLHSAAVHLLRRVRLADRTTGIGPAQLSALSVLVFGGSMSLGQLASAEQVKPPTMVRIVQSLADEGLVRTKPDRSDKRRIHIAATSRGRTLMMRARQKRVEVLAGALSTLSEAERLQLRSAVNVVRGVLKVMREPA
jgi:DNA-binding MarR family transcriptional regulator